MNVNITFVSLKLSLSYYLKPLWDLKHNFICTRPLKIYKRINLKGTIVRYRRSLFINIHISASALKKSEEFDLLPCDSVL